MRALLTAATLAAALAAATPAEACRCRPPGPPPDEMQQSTAVFRGRVERAEAAEHDGRQVLRVTLRLDASWKGAETPRVQVLTSAHRTACGVTFAPDEEYIVYCYGDQGAWITNTCTRTAVATTEEATALGAPMRTFVPEDGFMGQAGGEE